LEGLAGGEGRACWQDPGQLQRVERIATAHLPQALQARPGQRQPEPLTQQLVQNADGQGTHPQDQPLWLRKRLLDLQQQPVGVLGAYRDDQTEPLVAQPPQHEGQHPGRGPIQPLQIIDADHDGRVRGERAQDLQRGKRHSQLIDARLLGLAAQQRDLQGTPLRGRQLRQSRFGHALQQVDQAGRVASVWAARAASTVNERARAASSAACHTVVLPIPAGPSTTTARGPATTTSSMAVSCSSSAWRPSTTGAIRAQS
jgi:hypothetical protein